MIKYLKSFFLLLLPHERKLTLLLFLMTLAMVLIEMIGIVSILPFLYVLSDPSLIETNRILKIIFQFSFNKFGIETNYQFLLFLGTITFFLLLFSLCLKTLTIYAQQRFIEMRKFSLAQRLVKGYLHQSYLWFLSRHSSSLAKNILDESHLVISRGLHHMMNLIMHIFYALVIIIFLTFLDPFIMIVISFAFGISYGLIFLSSKKIIGKFGTERYDNNDLIFKSINETFRAIKQIKVSNLENVYIKRISKIGLILARNSAFVGIVAQIPRYFLELIVFGGMLLLTLYLMTKNGSVESALPLIVIYAVSGYKLMPAMQGIYISLINLNYVSISVEKINEELKTIKKNEIIKGDKNFTLGKSINLKNICFKYPDASRNALNDINLNIPAFSSVAIIGTTGSGKTTIVDVLLNLLAPHKGKIEVDGQDINRLNTKEWLRSIGYVPQQVFLNDDTIEANIAFGVDQDTVDHQLIRQASKIAQLDEFIMDELPNKYQTLIGEQGVRLSGGQRQRIGIARALYHKPKLLILDEATNALDITTEQKIMDEIFTIKNMTVIVITHRLEILKKCNKIILIDNGKIKMDGDYDSLIRSNLYFPLKDNN